MPVLWSETAVLRQDQSQTGLGLGLNWSYSFGLGLGLNLLVLFPSLHYAVCISTEQPFL